MVAFLFGQEDGLAFGGQNTEDVASPYGRLGDNLVRFTRRAEKIFEDHSLQLGPRVGWVIGFPVVRCRSSAFSLMGVLGMESF
jgi:hypothetical protein